MVASLIARGVTVSQGPLLVLADVDLTVAPGQRIGLVGPNGVGKTTLLGALAGRRALDAGTVDAAPPDSVIGLLPQEPERSERETVRAFLARRAGITTSRPVCSRPPPRSPRAWRAATTRTARRSTSG